MRVQEEEVKIKGFDTKVTHRDPKTGLIIKKTPYIKRVCGKVAGGSDRYFEKPAGSGNLFNKKGEPVGRWDSNLAEGKRCIPCASHIEFAVPQTEDDKLAKSLILKERENATLKAELNALKMEKEKKAEIEKSLLKNIKER